MFKMILAAFALATTMTFVLPAQAGGTCVDPVCATFLASELRSIRREVEELKGERSTVHVHKQVVVKKHVAKKEKRIIHAPTKKTHKVARIVRVVSKSVSGKSCAVFMQREPSALVAYHGSYENRGPVIGSFDPQWRKVFGGYTATVCVQKNRMVNVITFSMCGSVGHYDFNRTETAQFKRQSGPLGPDDVARMWNGG
jgi:hypothetical protein